MPNVTLIYLYRKVAQGSTVHSLLMDTSIRQAPVKLTPRVVPAFLYSLYLTLSKTDIYLRGTLSAGPKGVCIKRHDMKERNDIKNPQNTSVGFCTPIHQTTGL